MKGKVEEGGRFEMERAMEEEGMEWKERGFCGREERHRHRNAKEDAEERHRQRTAACIGGGRKGIGGERLEQREERHCRRKNRGK